jgi:hypothetical protein
MRTQNLSLVDNTCVFLSMVIVTNIKPHHPTLQDFVHVYTVVDHGCNYVINLGSTRYELYKMQEGMKEERHKQAYIQYGYITMFTHK